MLQVTGPNPSWSRPRSSSALSLAAFVAAAVALLFVKIINIILIFIFVALFIYIANLFLEKIYLRLAAEGVRPRDVFLYLRDKRENS